MLLAVDVGNTNIVFGVFEGRCLAACWRVRTERNATEDELYVLLASLFSSQGKALANVKDTIVSCVVPPITESLGRFCSKYLGKPPIWIDPARLVRMPINYKAPSEVGADRIVTAIAAYEKHKKSLVVVDFGTATTFDCVSEDGAYLGGAICPGMLVSADALFKHAAKLPPMGRLWLPDRAIATDTVSSMNAGVVFGHAAMVDGMVGRIRQEMAPYKPIVVATGGLASVISKAAKTIDYVEPDLTLEGLRIIYSDQDADTISPVGPCSG